MLYVKLLDQINNFLPNIRVIKLPATDSVINNSTIRVYNIGSWQRKA
ncbi:MAG: hypothetical protein GY820_35770 [Gammaproteobacteria bacterium]|nr:hypothetical protein [Gammaproteobacteria bacterium]